MTVFKSYWLLISHYKTMIVVYVSIFGIMAAMNALYASESAPTDFQQEAVDIAVVKGQGSTLEIGLEDYLSSIHNVKEFSGEEERNEALFFADISYIVDLSNGIEEINVTQFPNSSWGQYLNQQINSYVQQVTTYVVAGYSEEEAIELFMEGQAGVGEAKIHMTSKSGAEGGNTYNYLFRYYPYLFISVFCYAISTVLVSYRKKQTQMRIHCSPISGRRINLTGLLVFNILGLGLYLLSIIIPIFIYGESFYGNPNLIWYLLNTFSLLLVCSSLAFLVGIVNAKMEVVSAIANLLSLGLCFIGGVFVSIELLGEGVLQVAQLVPTYWYTIANDLLGSGVVIQGEALGMMARSIGIQLGFAVAFICMALVASKARSQAT